MLFSLSGPPGVGKSTLGALAAQRLGWRFIDLDQRLEESLGRSITSFISAEGVEPFRVLEREALRALLHEDALRETPSVLALGGGAALDLRRRAELRRAGALIGLDCPPRELLERLRMRPRPLLPRPTKNTLAALLEERADAYRDVDLRFELALGASPAQEAERLAQLLRLSWLRRRAPRRLFLSLAPSACPPHASIDQLTDEESRAADEEGRAAAEESRAADKGSERGPNERVSPQQLSPPLAYPVTFVDGAPEALFEMLSQLTGRLFLIADESCATLFGVSLVTALRARGCTAELLPFPGGEGEKHLETLSPLYESCLQSGIERRDWIIALGGGISGDIAGFLAATILRGVRWGLIPTTLLAQLDSSVGAKTGVNHPLGKNLIGAFHAPSFVWIDRAFLESLDARQRRAGWAEALKHGLLAGAPLWDQLLEALSASPVEPLPPLPSRDLSIDLVRVKAEIVSADERERGARRLLNLGHTLAHALEASEEGWLHGEAVALGLAFTLSWSCRWEGLPAARLSELLQLLQRLGLPADWRAALPRDLRELLRRDKKLDGGDLWYIVVPALGAAVVRRISLDEWVQRAETLQQLPDPVSVG